MKLRRVQEITKIPKASIKSKRHKVVQAMEKGDSSYYVVKIMVFHHLQDFLYFEKDVGDRLDVLKRINGLGIISLVENGMCSIEVKQGEGQWVVYLTRREVIGPTLSKILQKESLVVQILMKEGLKELIWNTFALMIAGGGFPTLIATLDNLIFEEIGTKYKPALNYFSFVGNRLLKFKKDIEKQEFIEIGMFLDEEALESGNIDRFEFKCRNFAVIVLSLLARRNPNIFIFDKVNLPNAISIQTAKQIYKNVIQPRLKELLSFKTLSNTFNYLKIPGLEDFVHSALGFQSKNQKAEDWSMVHNIMLEQQKSLKVQGSDQYEDKIGTILWQNEPEQQKEMLQRKGLGVGKNGTKIYMAFKLSVHLECLLQYNDWKSMMKKLKYNYKTHQLFYRLLQCSAHKDGPILYQTTNELLQISKESFKMLGVIDNKNIITHSFQRTVLDAYADLLQ